MAADLDAWRDTAERQADNPVALREILGRHAPALEQRIDLAIEQITAGRRDLEALDRHYRKAAQNAHALRMRIRDLRAENAFASLTWDTEEADRVWDEAMEAERDCQTARTLLQACDHLQRAVNAALQAEQLYSRVEHQMQSALRRLDDELRGLHAGIDRARKQPTPCANAARTRKPSISSGRAKVRNAASSSPTNRAPLKRPCAACATPAVRWGGERRRRGGTTETRRTQRGTRGRRRTRMNADGEPIGAPLLPPLLVLGTRTLARVGVRGVSK